MARRKPLSFNDISYPMHFQHIEHIDNNSTLEEVCNAMLPLPKPAEEAPNSSLSVRLPNAYNSASSDYNDEFHSYEKPAKKFQDITVSSNGNGSRLVPYPGKRLPMEPITIVYSNDCEKAVDVPINMQSTPKFKNSTESISISDLPNDSLQVMNTSPIRPAPRTILTLDTEVIDEAALNKHNASNIKMGLDGARYENTPEASLGPYTNLSVFGKEGAKSFPAPLPPKPKKWTMQQDDAIVVLREGPDSFDEEPKNAPNTPSVIINPQPAIIRPPTIAEELERPGCLGFALALDDVIPIGASLPSCTPIDNFHTPPSANKNKSTSQLHNDVPTIDAPKYSSLSNTKNPIPTPRISTKKIPAPPIPPSPAPRMVVSPAPPIPPSPAPRTVVSPVPSIPQSPAPRMVVSPAPPIPPSPAPRTVASPAPPTLDPAKRLISSPPIPPTPVAPNVTFFSSAIPASLAPPIPPPPNLTGKKIAPPRPPPPNSATKPKLLKLKEIQSQEESHNDNIEEESYPQGCISLTSIDAPIFHPAGRYNKHDRRKKFRSKIVSQNCIDDLNNIVSPNNVDEDFSQEIMLEKPLSECTIRELQQMESIRVTHDEPHAEIIKQAIAQSLCLDNESKIYGEVLNLSSLTITDEAPDLNFPAPDEPSEIFQDAPKKIIHNELRVVHPEYEQTKIVSSSSATSSSSWQTMQPGYIVYYHEVKDKPYWKTFLHVEPNIESTKHTECSPSMYTLPKDTPITTDAELLKPLGQQPQRTIIKKTEETADIEVEPSSLEDSSRILTFRL